MVKQIFFSHSSRDKLLREEIKKSLEEIGIKPYFAFLEQEGRDAKTKIEEAINDSYAVFVLVTENVLNNKHTRDWVSYEIGFARGLEKGEGKEKRVYAWLINADDQEDELAYLRYITDYKKIRLEYEEISTTEPGIEYRFKSSDIDDFVHQIREKASEIIELVEIPAEMIRKPLPKKVSVIPPTFGITQRLPNGIKREFPDVGFNIENPNDSPIRVKVLANVLLGDRDLGPLAGHYSGNKIWNLNPFTIVRGHFQIPDEAANSQERLEVKIKVTFIDQNDDEHELLPVGYVYMRDQNDWYFEP